MSCSPMPAPVGKYTATRSKALSGPRSSHLAALPGRIIFHIGSGSKHSNNVSLTTRPMPARA
eukprot:3565709-Pyramimonas_sp.AAC.1